MSVQPSVTIITPTYNRADYLTETIESVLRQGYKNLEYLVLDDGSTDNTQEVLKHYEGRLRWETHPNMGEAHTVNKGFAMAHGDYIVIVNSDDPVLPGLVYAAVDYLAAHPESLVVYPDWYKINEHSQKISDVYRRDYNYGFMLREGICLVGPGAFIRRDALSFIQGRNTDYRYVSDFDFWLRLGLYGPFSRIPEVLATHRVHSGSATVGERGVQMAKEHIQMYEHLFTQPNLPEEVQALREQSLSTMYYMAATQALSESYSLARRYFKYSFRLSKGQYLKHPVRFAYLLSTLFLPEHVQRWLFDRWKRISVL